MKKTIEYSNQFRKDFKKYANNPKKVSKILEVIKLLENDEEIPQNMRPHKLIGNYAGNLELHIEGDLLLVWQDKSKNTIKLVRLGSHSELF